MAGRTRRAEATSPKVGEDGDAGALIIAQNRAVGVVDLQRLAETARAYADDSRAANTQRAYDSDWRDFSTWCERAGFPSLPADGRVVALYITDQIERVAVTTIDRRLAAIRAVHRDGDYAIPEGAELRRVLSSIRRQHGRPAAPKQALLIEDLRRVVQAMPNTTAGLRDRALILVGWGGALRRSELASMTMEGEGAGPVWFRFVAGGLEVHIDRSKADQTGAGAIIGVPTGARLETCPVRAVKAWTEAAEISSGPLFREVGKSGRVGETAINPETVARVVKRSAERIGLDPAAFAGHSVRSGLATSAAAADASADVIMGQMRHKRFDTTRRYIQAGQRFKRNAASIAGL